jgi:hypothetical protein
VIQSAIKPHGNRFRPIADLQPSSAMLRCGPSVRTFAARAKFEDGRTHSVRTFLPFGKGPENSLGNILARSVSLFNT